MSFFFFQMLHSLAILLVTIFLAFLGCSVERLLAWHRCAARGTGFLFLFFSNFWKRDLWSAWFLLPFCNRACAPSPPLHTQLHLSNASELKGKKKLFSFFFFCCCPNGDYTNAMWMRRQVWKVEQKRWFLFPGSFGELVFWAVIECMSSHWLHFFFFFF